MKTFIQRATLAMALIGLPGCNSLSRDAVETMRLAVSGPESVISTSRVDAVDAPVLLAELDGAEALLVAPGAATGRAEWHGVTEMLLTHNGRLVQSAGLPVDVIAPLVVNDPFLAGLHHVPSGTEVTRLVDYPGQYRTGLRQHARYRVGKLESITYMGARHRLLRIDEMIHMPELGFRATNRYWIEPDTGLVRHSVQHLSPDMPPLVLTLARTEGGTRP